MFLVKIWLPLQNKLELRLRIIFLRLNKGFHNANRRAWGSLRNDQRGSVSRLSATTYPSQVQPLNYFVSRLRHNLKLTLQADNMACEQAKMWVFTLIERLGHGLSKQIRLKSMSSPQHPKIVIWLQDLYENSKIGFRWQESCRKYPTYWTGFGVILKKNTIYSWCKSVWAHA